MGNCQKASLILAWCCVRTLAVIVEHHPVLEGSSTTLVCAGNASGDRSVYWRKVFPNTTYVQIANCHSTHGYECIVKFPGYSATYISSNDTFNSSLTFSVSTKERNMAYNCSLFIHIEDSSRFIRTWNFSMNYHPAEYAACNVSRVNFLNISINCSIHNIYPGFFCEVFEINESKNSIAEDSAVQYKLSHIDSRGYRTAFCYVDIQITHPRTYKYRVKIYPDVALKTLKRAVREIQTDEVVISGNPTVKMQQEPCPGNGKVLVFGCKTYWLLTKPRFQWYVDQEVVRETSSSVIVENGNSHFVSQIELSGNTSQNGKHITCEAHYGSQTLTNETKFITHLFPTPQPPQFTTNDNIIMGSSFTAPEEEQMNMFTCKAMGNTENIIRVNVTCKSDANTLVNIEGYKASISFNINYTLDQNSVHCVCSVLYTTQCDLLTQLSIIKLKITSQWQRFDTTQVIVYIAAGFVLLIVFILLLGTLMFLRNHWSELYTYVYSKLYANTSINTGLLDGVYTCVNGVVKQTYSSSVCTHSPSSLDNETAESLMSSEITHTVCNNSQVTQEYSDSGCYVDLESLPPQLPPRDPLSSVAIIPVTRSRHTSQTTEPASCKLILTDDGYLKPLPRLPSAEYVTRDTLPFRRHHEVGTLEPDQYDYDPTANYIQVLPDLPPRSPLLVGRLKNVGPPLGHTSGFLQASPTLPPRKPLRTAVVNSRTETVLSHSTMPNRMNWTNT